MFCINAYIVIYVIIYTLVMELVKKSELIKLAKMQDPESELYKMTYWDIRKIKDKIEKLVHTENDDRLFSILMKLKSHIMITEDWIREQEISKMKKHSTIEEFTNYINKSKMLGSGRIYA